MCPPISFEDYKRDVWQEWQHLLDSAESASEAVFQSFLEENVCLLPGTYGLIGCGHHGALPPIIYSQAELPGWSKRIPDFMWLAQDSEAVTAVLVEIETPSKRWFTRSGEFSADFTHARGQLLDWQVWFEEPSNVIKFHDTYRIPRRTLEDRVFKQVYILVYGNRAEFEGKGTLAKKRGVGKAPNEFFLTYSRLEPTHDLADHVTVRMKHDPGRSLQVLHIPPTLRMGRDFSVQVAPFTNRAESIDRNRRISNERKAFMKSRLEYWDTAPKPTGFTPVSSDLE